MVWWKPLTIKYWNFGNQVVDKVHNDVISKLAGLTKYKLDKIWKSLVAYDSCLDINVIVSECKHACAAYRANYAHYFIIFKSYWVHLLYPADFLYHVIDYHKNSSK